MIQLLLPLFSLIAGGLVNALPLLFSYLDKKATITQSIELAKIQGEQQKENLSAQQKIADLKADVDEGKSLRDHDSSLHGGEFVDAMRASVRPVVTYIFLCLFVFTKCVALYHVMVVQGADFSLAFPLIWDETTSSIFASIIGFWFGGRILEKQIGKSSI